MPTRETDDVDIVVQLATDLERTALDEQLRRAGLQHDISGPICRWRFQGLIVDVMPADISILGFSNRWYPEAMRGSEAVVCGGCHDPHPTGVYIPGHEGGQEGFWAFGF